MSLFISTALAALVLASTIDAQDCTPLLDAAGQTAELSTLVELVGVAGVEDALTGGDKSLTLFAPTNDAFAAVGTTEELSADPMRLAQILGNHIAPAALKAADLSDGQTLMTMNPWQLTVGVAEGVVTVTVPGSNVAMVVTPDIEVCEGVVHIIDAVLVDDLPASEPAMAPMATMGNCSTVLDVADMTPGLSTLVDAAFAADIVELLADDTTELTVFAPTNVAFDAVPNLQALLADKPALTAVLSDHVVAGTYTAADLTDGLTLTTVQDTTLTVTVANGVVSITAPGSGTTAIVTLPDVEACDSIVHVVDTVLVAGDMALASGNQTPTDRSSPGGGSGAAGVTLGGAALVAAAAAAVLL